MSDAETTIEMGDTNRTDLPVFTIDDEVLNLDGETGYIHRGDQVRELVRINDTLALRPVVTTEHSDD